MLRKCKIFFGKMDAAEGQIPLSVTAWGCYAAVHAVVQGQTQTPRVSLTVFQSPTVPVFEEKDAPMRMT